MGNPYTVERVIMTAPPSVRILHEYATGTNVLGPAR